MGVRHQTGEESRCLRKPFADNGLGALGGWSNVFLLQMALNPADGTGARVLSCCGAMR